MSSPGLILSLSKGDPAIHAEVCAGAAADAQIKSAGNATRTPIFAAERTGGLVDWCALVRGHLVRLRPFELRLPVRR